MPKFKKTILKAGVHRVRRVDGREEAENIPAERIAEWIKNTKKALKLGVKIPAPFLHQDKDKKLVTPLVIGDDGASVADGYSFADLQQNAWDQSINSGFWEDYELGKDGELVGILESPGDANDDATPAGKIGKTYQETSVFVLPSAKVKGSDGTFHDIGEHLAHVAVCLHGQEKGQSNFEPLESPALGMAMMFGMSDMISPASQTVGGGRSTYGQSVPLGGPAPPQDEELNELLGLFRSNGVDLPEDTTRENLIERLRLVLRQKVCTEQQQQQEEDSLLNRPDDAMTQSSSIAMSATTATTTTKPATSDAILMGMLVKDKRKSLKERVQALVASGRTTQEYANTKLLPKIDAFAMSASDLLEDGTGFKTSPLEDLIEGLEAASPLAGTAITDSDDAGSSELPEGASVELLPITPGDDLADDAMDALLDRAL